MNDKYLDEEEKDLLESYDSIDITTLKNPTKEEQEEFIMSAREFMKKETKMNIRIDEYELMKIKEYAEKEGLRYQTFVKSVLHKYITGQLTEKRRVG